MIVFKLNISYICKKFENSKFEILINLINFFHCAVLLHLLVQNKVKLSLKPIAFQL